ncbi:MAG: hypothetical protein WCP65_05140, partial [Bacteroidota bacterium]
MTKFLFTLFFISTISTVQAQTAPAVQWQNAIGGKNMGFVHYMTPTKDSGYIAVGYADSVRGKNIPNYHGLIDVWVAKLDSRCNIIWQKCYGGSGAEFGYTIEQTTDGGYIVAGETGSNNGDVSGNHGQAAQGDDIWVFKIDSIGNLKWQKCYGGSDEESVNAIHCTPDGGYIVAGYTRSNDGDVTGFHQKGISLDFDGWVIKLDSIGKLQWQKCLGGSSEERLYEVLPINGGNYIVTGNASSFDGDVKGVHLSANGWSDAWVIELDSIGNIVWQKCYGGSSSDFGYKMTKIIDGFIIGGETSSNDGDVNNNHGKSDIWIIKIDSIGNLIWQKGYGGSNSETLGAIIQTKNKGFVISGQTQSNDSDVSGFHGIYDYWVLKVDSIGNLLWQKCIGGSSSDQAYTLNETYDGGLIVGGISDTPVGDGDVTIHYLINNAYTDNWWIVKLAPELLPVRILRFKAAPLPPEGGMKGNALLNWVTTDEVNVNHFNIQRSV